MASAVASFWCFTLNFLRPEDDAFADFRERIATQIFVISAMLLLPFGLVHLAGGRYPSAALIMGTVCVLTLDWHALKHGRRAPVPMSLITVALCAVVGETITVQGMTAVPWVYPTQFAFFFILKRRAAMMSALLLMLISTTCSAVAIGWPMATRVLAAMSLVLLMIHVVLNVIGQLQRALVAQAITDPLTGAYNRRHFDSQLAGLPLPAATASDEVNVLLAMDLDHFKLVNDTYGHAVGDVVLRGAVGVISDRKRPTDQLFRTGGEEFMLLLQRTRPADAAKLADDLRRRIEAASLLEDRSVTISVGVSAERPGIDRTTWMRAADEALYRAKNEGRNRVVVAA